MTTDCIFRKDALDFLIPTYDLNISVQDQRIVSDRLVEFPENIPAADVVEVVRCKDCYAYQRYPHLAEAAGLNPVEYCALLRCEFGPDGFCSYGRRADNDQR